MSIYKPLYEPSPIVAASSSFPMLGINVQRI